MVFIKAGTFFRIKYPVTLTHDFLLAKYEVTPRSWAKTRAISRATPIVRLRN
jgi:hypothetical protein